MTDASYHFIEPLPKDADTLSSHELRGLARVWRDRRSELGDAGALDEFRKRLAREWAIETGIIERLYTWDRGVTEVLISQGIDAAIIAHQGRYSRDEAADVAGLIEDQRSVVEGLYEFVAEGRPLTEYFVRTMHQQMTRRQATTEAIDMSGARVEIELLRGEYKRRPNNPRREDGSVHQYCPPEHVDSEMASLIAWYQEAEGNPNVAPETLSAWLHHRFTQIHPFQDGNGRIARALASVVFLKHQLFPLVVRDADRKAYISALEAADAGDLAPLIQLFVRRQKQAILTALGLEQQAQRARAAEEVFLSVIRDRQRRDEKHQQAIAKVGEIAPGIVLLAQGRLEALATMANQQLSSIDPRYHATVHSASEAEGHWYRREIVAAARRLDYFANFDAHRDWIRLTIKTDVAFILLISIHGLGHSFQGVLAVSAAAFRRVDDESGVVWEDSVPATDEVFQFNYTESEEEATKRFAEWLDATAAIGMAIWSKSPGM